MAKTKEHTKGKLRVGRRKGGYEDCIYTDDEREGCVAECHPVDDCFRVNEAIANAHRICECVNGWDDLQAEHRADCQQIAHQTESIEKLIADGLKLEGQRDELLEALKMKSYDLLLPGNKSGREDAWCCSICGCNPHHKNCKYRQAISSAETE